MATDKIVAAPYVTLKVKGQQGQDVTLGFYEGAILPDGADSDDLERLIRKGMVVEADSPEAEFAVPAGTPKPGEPPNVPVTEQPVQALPLEERQRRQMEAAEQGEQRGGRPRVNASKEDWVEYAVTQRADGVSEDDARAEAQAMSKADLIAKSGG
jgi:hypothetical protein